MAKNFNELLAKMTPERRAEVERRVRETLAQMQATQSSTNTPSS